MRFLARSLLGILLTAVTLGLLLVAAGSIMRAGKTGDRQAGFSPESERRAVAARVATVVNGTATPVITAYGEVLSARQLEVRAARAGRLVELAGDFRDGGAVAEGDVLFRIDPAEAVAGLALARAEAEQAAADAEDAAAALELAAEELDVAQQQRDLRAQALARQQDLQGRGAGTAAAVETAELALSSAEQTLVGQRQAMAQARARVATSRIAVGRAGINAAEAERALADTVTRAPFAGVLSNADAVLGRLVGGNEKLADLIDPTALEVSFRLSNAAFARLAGADGRPRAENVTVTLMLGDIPVTTAAVLDRAGAAVEEGRSGRQVYARLTGPAPAFRPGDFVTVEIAQPPLADVATLPARALSADDGLLLIGPENRLDEIVVQVAARQGDLVFVAGAPEGREYLTERSPQLGPGMVVQPVRDGQARAVAETVTLDPARRDQLLAAVAASAMPDAVKNRLTRELQAESVPAEMVARIEAGIADIPDAAASAGSEMIALDAERRARLIAFVEETGGMPAEAKARILAQLGEAEVPKAMVERLESRMGG